MKAKVITIAFLGQAGGPVLATASSSSHECNGDVSFTIEGREQPPLTPSGSFWHDVLATAGVRWRGYYA
jgi:hypothetical protein